MLRYRVAFRAACLMVALSATVAQNPLHAQEASSAQSKPAETQNAATGRQAPPAFDRGKVFTLQQVAQAGRVSLGTPDPQIAAALRAISTAHVRQNIEKLASFVNRNTNGSRYPELEQKGVGIVAAREWIRSQFEAYSQACGGCLEVKEDKFIAQPGNTPDGRAQAGTTTAAPTNPNPNARPAPARIDQPTELVNVYAVMRGSDPEQANRIYLVSGHYDSFFANAGPGKSSAQNMLDVNSPALTGGGSLGYNQRVEQGF